VQPFNAGLRAQRLRGGQDAKEVDGADGAEDTILRRVGGLLPIGADVI
jgi:hypothetical protein